ncbi:MULTISPECIES: SpoVA/SpoVAEb family sporulation membrane protein [Gordonibacter]|uniref:SpoVA/SpoVAEb family sporulation membrane protein n=1 Tax=Gordonibacter faecis TaxID=3047475 RepID=A0ABT7DN30_9ACTN|nr:MULTISPECIES: SpoVA/SpoVAEb family sporulation membrane protein [unclassified Gordonibacter]MDJ1650933.1 SpoVA/SpoVAEb family sporulation membrane protein [Gordonibacter sp. KGMB12511]HIW75021.1 SpoVA/SpoVAEb family sporulation membrane protein [Candidatus Gordonibacter avicola]
MEFIMAFLVGGALCLLFQLILDVTKAPVPYILLVGLAVGGILTPFGIMDVLANWGGAGFTIMVVGAGQAMCATTQAALAGNPWPLLSVIGVFLVLTVVGLVCGSCHRALHPSKASANAAETGTQQAAKSHL